MENTVSIFPKKWRIVSGSALKVLAVVTMLIDHVAAFLLVYYPMELFTVGGEPVTLYWVMRRIGRLAFPIYCFLLVEGFLHTRNRLAYGRNLLLFALLSELPWNLLLGNSWFYETQNVFFTLFLGYLGLCVIERYQKEHTKQFLLLLVLLAAAFLLRADYGAGGFGFILIVYMLRERRDWQAVVGCCVLSGGVSAGLAFIPINLYNGERGFIKGKVLKYAFYAFYPVHMIILYLIRTYYIFA